jgi:hypothetical protein
MRTIGAVIMSLMLASSAFAASGSTAALAPGQPAGVHQAQMHGHAMLWLLGAGIVAGGIALAVSGDSNGHVTPPGTTPTTSTSTTTSTTTTN